MNERNPLRKFTRPRPLDEPAFALERLPGESDEHWAAIQFCFGDTRGQIRESEEEAHARGLNAATEEEREARRFDVAEQLLASDDDELRAVARRFLVIPERGAA